MFETTTQTTIFPGFLFPTGGELFEGLRWHLQDFAQFFALDLVRKMGGKSRTSRMHVNHIGGGFSTNPSEQEWVEVEQESTNLVGGWTNPIETYARQNGFIFPQVSGWKINLSCHQLDQGTWTSWCLRFADEHFFHWIRSDTGASHLTWLYWTGVCWFGMYWLVVEPTHLKKY